jgi:hypothetical protein
MKPHLLPHPRLSHPSTPFHACTYTRRTHSTLHTHSPTHAYATLHPHTPPPHPSRDLTDKYYLGRIIGAGSFGVVREGVEVATGRRYAVKTVSKVPKRGPPTPR